MKHEITVNQQVIRANSATGQSRAPISVKHRSGRTELGSMVELLDAEGNVVARFKYERARVAGAQVWCETNLDVRITP